MRESLQRDSFEGENYVAGPVSIFQTRMFPRDRRLYSELGGGVDLIAVTTARMKGFKKVDSFPLATAQDRVSL